MDNETANRHSHDVRSMDSQHDNEIHGKHVLFGCHGKLADISERAGHQHLSMLVDYT